TKRPSPTRSTAEPLSTRWSPDGYDIPACDGILLGNFLHAFADQVCVDVCRESFERLNREAKFSSTRWSGMRIGMDLSSLPYGTQACARLEESNEPPKS